MEYCVGQVGTLPKVPTEVGTGTYLLRFINMGAVGRYGTYYILLARYLPISTVGRYLQYLYSSRYPVPVPRYWC